MLSNLSIYYDNVVRRSEFAMDSWLQNLWHGCDLIRVLLYEYTPTIPPGLHWRIAYFGMMGF
jgi:hypothetical protein